MALSNRYRKSKCRGNYLHKFKEVSIVNGGVYERCERCGLGVYFPANAPNLFYLQFNIRRVLKASDPLFNREYPHIQV